MQLWSVVSSGLAYKDWAAFQVDRSRPRHFGRPGLDEFWFTPNLAWRCVNYSPLLARGKFVVHRPLEDQYTWSTNLACSSPF